MLFSMLCQSKRVTEGWFPGGQCRVNGRFDPGCAVDIVVSNILKVLTWFDILPASKGMKGERGCVSLVPVRQIAQLDNKSTIRSTCMNGKVKGLFGAG